MSKSAWKCACQKTIAFSIDGMYVLRRRRRDSVLLSLFSNLEVQAQQHYGDSAVPVTMDTELGKLLRSLK